MNEYQKTAGPNQNCEPYFYMADLDTPDDNSDKVKNPDNNALNPHIRPAA